MNRENRTMHIGIATLGGILIGIVVGSLLCPFDPFKISLNERNCVPNAIHWFGTDDLGRDLFSRTLQGLRISLGIGLCAAIIDLILGALGGVVVGFSPAWLEKILVRIAEIIYGVPFLLVAILTSVWMGPGLISVVASLVCIGWIQMFRMVRHLIKQTQQTEYVMAARALGASPCRQFFSHMLPNMLGPIMTAVVLSIPQAIFTEAFVSFLGIGVQPPQASLGSMISDAIPAIRFYPWRLFFPTMSLSLLLISIVLITDQLRDQYDPKKRLFGDI